MNLTDLMDAVNRRFVAFDPVSWPDPHPNMSAPSDEEYSRVTRPERYDIIRQRCDAWVDVLTERLEAVSAPCEPVAFHGVPGGSARRVCASMSGTLALIVSPTHGPSLDGVLLAAADSRGTFGIRPVPVCGCDACDDGSQALLDEIDAVIASVVTGDLVVLEGGGESVTRSGDGTYALGSIGVPHDVAMLLTDLIAAGEPVDLPPGVTARWGRPWPERQESAG